MNSKKSLKERLSLASYWYIICIFLLVLPMGCTSHSEEDTTSKPNIIYIMADDLGYGDLGSYGQQKIRTPNLDQMASKGMRFTQHYAGSTVCAPSRGVLMTGKHTGHAYIKGNFAIESEGNLPIPDSTVTIAELLQNAGYTTAMIGKWGLGGPGSVGGPNRQGFDYSYGYLDQRNAHEYYPPYIWENERKVMLENEDKQREYTHDLFTQKALDFIDENSDRPFFLYLPYTIPHGKYQVPDDAPYTDKNWSQTNKNYAAMITRMDRDVGHILKLLKQKDIDKNTIVFFTSDNGPVSAKLSTFFNSNGKLKGYKTDLWEGGIRVPLIARWPGHIKAGSTSDHISAFWDFMPTACDIAGIQPPSNIDGISYLPELLGKEQKTHDYLYWEYFRYHYGWEPGDSGSRNSLTSQAVRMGKWKGVKTGIYRKDSVSIKLFNLKKDISEEHNVAGEHPKIVGKIEAIMKASHRDTEYFQMGNNYGK